MLLLLLNVLNSLVLLYILVLAISLTAIIIITIYTHIFIKHKHVDCNSVIV